MKYFFIIQIKYISDYTSYIIHTLSTMSGLNKKICNKFYISQICPLLPLAYNKLSRKGEPMYLAFEFRKYVIMLSKLQRNNKNVILKCKVHEVPEIENCKLYYTEKSNLQGEIDNDLYDKISLTIKMLNDDKNVLNKHCLPAYPNNKSVKTYYGNDPESVKKFLIQLLGYCKSILEGDEIDKVIWINKAVKASSDNKLFIDTKILEMEENFLNRNCINVNEKVFLSKQIMIYKKRDDKYDEDRVHIELDPSEHNSTDIAFQAFYDGTIYGKLFELCQKHVDKTGYYENGQNISIKLEDLASYYEKSKNCWSTFCSCIRKDRYIERINKKADEINKKIYDS